MSETRLHLQQAAISDGWMPLDYTKINVRRYDSANFAISAGSEGIFATVIFGI